MVSWLHSGRAAAAPPLERARRRGLPAPAMVPPTELADMEGQLLQRIEITGDDFRQLMQERANQVEAYLLKSGKVTADRLFITVPKPMDPKSEARVNLTLD